MNSFFSPPSPAPVSQDEESGIEPWSFEPWRELSGLAWMGLEVIWVALWFSGISRLWRPVSFGRAVLVLGLFLLVSHYLSRLFAVWEVKEKVRRWAFVIFLAAIIWLGLNWLYHAPDFLGPFRILAILADKFAGKGSIPAELAVILLVLAVAWRGIVLARRQPTVDALLNSFQLGAIMLIIYGVLLLANQLVSALTALYLFLFIGLAGMSAARLNELGHMRGGKRVVFSYRWLGGIGFSSLIVVILGLIPVLILRSPVGALLVEVISFVLGAVAVVIAAMMLPFAKLLLEVLSILAGVFQGGFSYEGYNDLQNLIRKWIESQGQRSYEDLVRLVHLARPFILWGLILAVIVAIILALRWQSQRARRMEAAQNKDLLNMADLLKNLGDALLKRAQEAADALAARLGLGSASRLFQAARIRWVYFQLMGLSADLGRARPASVTPLEFLPDLTALFPEQPADLALITQAYLRVRYGELPESQEEVEEVLKAWDRVEAFGRQLKAVLKMK